MVLVVKIVSKKSLVVKLEFDISKKLSTRKKKPSQKCEGFFYGLGTT